MGQAISPLLYIQGWRWITKGIVVPAVFQDEKPSKHEAELSETDVSYQIPVYLKQST